MPNNSFQTIFFEIMFGKCYPKANEVFLSPFSLTPDSYLQIRFLSNIDTDGMKEIGSVFLTWTVVLQVVASEEASEGGGGFHTY